MSRTVLWQCVAHPMLEFFQWTNDPEVVLRGEVVGNINGIPGRVRYRVRVGANHVTQGVRIHFWSDAGHRHLHLDRSQSDSWKVDGVMRPDLGDATDVDIGITPATNTLPLRRFGLAVGESRDLVAAWVQFPTLSVVAAHQRYTRTADDRYRYQSLDSGYQAELIVRGDGLVVKYADIWHMLTIF